MSEAISASVLAERERKRCAQLAEDLINVIEASCDKIERDLTITTRSVWPPFRKRTVVSPAAAKFVKDQRYLADLIRQTIMRPIMSGARPVSWR